MSNTTKRAKYKEEKTRFSMLRYENDDDLSGKPTYTVDDIATKTGLSKGTISKLENQKLEPDEAPNASAATIKCIHDTMGVSYEYLMGETESKKNKYEFGKDPILGLLNDDFWDHLKTALVTSLGFGTDELDMNRVYLLRALLSNPEGFAAFLDSTFEYLYDVFNHIGLAKGQNEKTKNLLRQSLSVKEYTYSQGIFQFLKDDVIDILLNPLQDFAEMKPKLDETTNEMFRQFLNKNVDNPTEKESYGCNV